MKLRLNAMWCIASLLCAGLFLLPETARPDPRRWDPDGLRVRQGHHIEWQRSCFRRADGSMLVVWSDCRTGDRDVYGQLVSPNGTSQWADDGLSVVHYPYRQEDPDVTAADGENWIIAWVDFREDTLGDVWAQKINSSGQHLWAQDGVLVDRFTSTEFHMVNELSVRIVYDGQGGAIVAWEDNRNGDEGDIFAQRLDANGNRVWTNPLRVTSITGAQVGITADADGAGNMVVAWNDKRDGLNQDIYAAKVTRDGQLPWGGVNGRAVCTAAGLQKSVKICPDGQRGAYLVWVDNREGASADLYMQRVDSAGTIRWAADGANICNAPQDQIDARIVTSFISGTTPDGVIVAWEDSRVNGLKNEVYAQKLNPQGQALWTANGVKVCGDATEDGGGMGREGVRLASDLAGGTICAWEDKRLNEDQEFCDLYARRITNDGTLQWGDCGIAISTAQLAQNQPVLRFSDNAMFVFYDDLRSGSQSLRYQKADLISGALLLNPEGVEVVAGIDGNSETPLTVALSPGRTAIVWVDYRFGRLGQAMFYQIVSDTGGHLERDVNGDTLVPDNEGNLLWKQEKPRVCPDGSGGFYVTFEDVRVAPRRIRVTHVNAAGQLDVTRSGIVIDPAPNIQKPAFCCPDGAGGCYIAYDKFNSDFSMDLWIQRVNTQCQPQWASPVRLTNSADDDELAGIVPSTDGCCYVTWRTGYSGEYDIHGARICNDGSVAWNEVVCDAINDQMYPKLASDGRNGVYITWQDMRAPIYAFDIYAQYLDSAGSPMPGWSPNGNVVISDSLNQQYPYPIADGNRNCYIIWADFRNEEDANYYGQKLAPSGTLLWASGGRPICTAPGGQGDNLDQLPGFIDYSNGLWLAWTDGRGLFYDIYGTHINAQGNETVPYWVPGSGGVICNYWESQYDPSVASDYYGGVVCSFTDLRSTGKEKLLNVYAQRLNDFTVDVRRVDQAPIPRQSELGQNYPNPFNPVTTIEFSIARTERVEISVFNTLGQQVAMLVDGVMTAGKYALRFDAQKLSSGTYYYRLKTGDVNQVKKMTLLK
jgi:hypothetical protein